MNDLQTDSGTYWKMTLFVIVGLFFAAMVASLVFARLKVSRVVDTEYYSHGLHYAESHSMRGNPGLSWTMTASAIGNELRAVVMDGAGSPVTGGRLMYDLDRNNGGRIVARIFLGESSPGVYSTLRTVDTMGDLSGTMRFTKGDATVTSRVVVIN